jgi:hypothetical protein
VIRPTHRALLAAAAALLLVLAVTACGGGSSSSSSSAPVTTAPSSGGAKEPAEETSTAYVKPAEATCHQLLREAQRIGRKFIAEYAASENASPEQFEMSGLIRPGVHSLERISTKFRALSERYPNPNFALYVGLYEPLLQLAHLRLAAGEDEAEGKSLEGQMEAVGAEQRLAAKQAGLKACQIDFLHALVASWSNP